MAVTVPRNLVRQFRSVLRRLGPPRGPLPFVVIRAGPEGLFLQAVRDEAAVRYHHPGDQAPDTLKFSGEALARFEGTAATPVTLEVAAAGTIRACWQEQAVPRACEFPAVEADSGLPFPDVPEQFASLPPAFLSALAEASRTAARDTVRLGMTRVQLRGKKGEVVGTDGRQLLLQGGFEFPFAKDLLVPALPAFASPELPRDEPVGLGITATQVGLRAGPWTLLLAVDKDSRYPQVDMVVPAPRATPSRLELDPRDAEFLIANLAKLPGQEDDRPQATLDLGEEAVLRVRGEGAYPPTDVVLARSRCTGPDVRLATERAFLLRALQLGFREVTAGKPDTPLVCREDSRCYLWMPLPQQEVVPPDPRAARVLSTPADAALPPAPRRKPIMPRPIPEHQPTRNGPRADSPASLSADNGGPTDLLSEADAIRVTLQETCGRLGRLVAALKLQRRHDRALRAAVDSLRQLPPLLP
jgi:hypothetical protein